MRRRIGKTLCSLCGKIEKKLVTINRKKFYIDVSFAFWNKDAAKGIIDNSLGDICLSCVIPLLQEEDKPTGK